VAIDPRSFLPEVRFRAVRSRGKGGQNVNKVSTKVELTFDIPASVKLDEAQKETLQEKLRTRVTKEGILHLTCDSERSQWANKLRVFERFLLLVTEALTPQRKRIPTRPGKAVKEQRLRDKKAQSEKKARRRYRGNGG
jgi:ribosome-associated protein